MKRTDTYFISSGARCAAWFWEPEGAGPCPAVLLCHGFGAIKEARLDAYGDRFAQAGFAVLAIDYRHFGGSEGEPRHFGSVRRQLEDIAAALAHLRAQPQVDPNRVALWGTSFGGGHVLVTAAHAPQQKRRDQAAKITHREQARHDPPGRGARGQRQQPASVDEARSARQAQAGGPRQQRADEQGGLEALAEIDQHGRDERQQRRRFPGKA